MQRSQRKSSEIKRDNRDDESENSKNRKRGNSDTLRDLWSQDLIGTLTETKGGFYHPDYIDIRLLMSSRDELILPRDELFTANDIRSLSIIPFRKQV